MTSGLISVDREVQYEVHEVAVIVAALAFIIACGGVAIAAIIICGWRGAQSVVVDWIHGRVTFVCR
jgi:hypothetical protein